MWDKSMKNLSNLFCQGQTAYSVIGKCKVLFAGFGSLKYEKTRHGTLTSP